MRREIDALWVQNSNDVLSSHRCPETFFIFLKGEADNNLYRQ